MLRTKDVENLLERITVEERGTNKKWEKEGKNLVVLGWS